MTVNAFAVIGSNFGDEGKGLFTDYLAAQNESTIVCRFNGGSQAGHTVQTPDGRRHVFSHFGAGTLAGRDTFLSRFFISNPFTFLTERKALTGLLGDDLGGSRVLVDRRSLLTTPFDMLMNRAAEVVREGKGGRHGSVGLGINETVVRSLTDYATTVDDLFRSGLKDKITTIREEYAPKRIVELGVPEEAVGAMIDIWDDETIEKYLEYSKTIVDHLTIADQDILNSYGNIVFEGAQGLLLDEDHSYFPHVTRSKTGANNVATMADELGIGWVDTIYATRTHMSRHGAGPFETEDPDLQYEDLTNKPNDWQQSIRFGILDVDLWKRTVLDDINSVSGRDVVIGQFVGLSWCPKDRKELVRIKYYGKTIEVPAEELTEILGSEIGADVYVADGKTREDVHAPD